MRLGHVVRAGRRLSCDVKICIRLFEEEFEMLDELKEEEIVKKVGGRF